MRTVSDTPLKIAQLGAGRIGHMHARLLVAHPRVGSMVVSDAFPAAAEKLAAEIGGTTATNDEVFAEGNPLGIDAVVISAATSTHADLLTRCARAGLPVFCEKPIALDLTEARAAQKALDESGVAHQIGFHRRFDTGYNRAKALLDSGELGELRRFHALTCDQLPPPDEYLPGSGGIYRDCSVHDFDILRWITGVEVEEVYATGSQRGSAGFAAADDLADAVAILRFTDGTVGTLQTSRYNGQGHEVRLDLSGTKGSANVGLDEKVPMRSTEEGVTFPSQEPWADFIERFLPCYERELDHFLTVVLEGGESPCTSEDAVAALVIAMACDLSRHENRVVKISEIADAG